MKKIKSLVAAFTLATAGMMTMGAASAEAQTVPVYQGQVYTQPAQSRPVSQGAIDDLAYNVGVQTVYYRAGSGFTQGTASNGENIGLEFRLDGNNATVARAYNLDDPNARYQFQQRVNYEAAQEQALADQEYRAQRPVYTYYEPQTYVICPPVVPVIGIGWIIGGWHPGYVPVYHRWDGFWDDHGRRNHPHHGGRNTTIINNHTTIIDRGGHGHQSPWIGGGHRDNHNGGQWRGGGNHHTIVNNPPPVVRTPPVRHAEPRHVEPRRAEPRRVEIAQQPRQRVAEVQPQVRQRQEHQGGQQQRGRQHDSGGRHNR